MSQTHEITLRLTDEEIADIVDRPVFGNLGLGWQHAVDKLVREVDAIHGPGRAPEAGDWIDLGPESSTEYTIDKHHVLEEDGGTFIYAWPTPDGEDHYGSVFRFGKLSPCLLPHGEYRTPEGHKLILKGTAA